MIGRLRELCTTDPKMRSEFADVFAQDVSVPAWAATRPTCRYRGALVRVDEQIVKDSGCCGGHAVATEVYQCENRKRPYRQCSPAECEQCTLYEIPPLDLFPSGEPTRHLAYHVCPIAGNGVWQANVRQVVKRWHVFTGRKRIAIVTGEVRDRDGKPARFDEPATVRAAFPDDAEFIEVDNDATIGEGRSFVPLIEPLVSDDRNAATFYAHTKGAGRQGQGNTSVAYGLTVNGWTIAQWVALMYSACLDYLPLVHNQLQRHAITGPFRIPGKLWFYSGAFFWVRNHHLVARDWRRLPAEWGCVERWPRAHFPPEQTGCLFWDKHANLYDAATMATVRREFAEWSRVNGKYRNSPIKEGTPCQ